jgi:sugar O-acyltransferase (sialic acid O-acetyltransferase NeuD family)
MIIIGAGGFAKELLELIVRDYPENEIFLYDDVSADVPGYLYDRFKVLRKEEEAVDIFRSGKNEFVLGLGNPFARRALCRKFLELGGQLMSVCASDAKIGSFDNMSGPGTTIMQGVIVTNSVRIGQGVLLNLGCTIGHDSSIGDFSSLSPGVRMSGNAAIGSCCNVGTNAVLLPGVVIGNEVIVGAGAVVTSNLPDGVTAVGVPARIISKH